MAVFVTVGTTQFDLLIQKMLSEEVLDLLSKQGYTTLRLQVGRGSEPLVPTKAPLSIDWYRFKPSLEEDMAGASLLISHAGAGSILEGMRLRSRMIVVVNDALMDNHQTELADELASLGHCLSTTPSGLIVSLRDLQERESEFAPFPPADKEAFPRFLDSHLGLA
ncbi:hypothetical protein AB1Y20_015488 [Prymnesium parvum]|uniref:UDP-N-acetylglucosamine transferase subunit ALG13 n=1 Tax=Prymnesium parvum TaxID=97485 RepID=A0AB34K0D1_PRYPA